MDVKINNPENIPEEIVEKAIAMMEREEGRKVVRVDYPADREPGRVRDHSYF